MHHQAYKRAGYCQRIETIAHGMKKEGVKPVLELRVSGT
jgi:hypothetical protein